MLELEGLLQGAVASSFWGIRKPARFRRSLIICPLMEASSAVLEWRLDQKHKSYKMYFENFFSCMFLCVYVLPWWYVDLKEPGFQVLIQHDVKAEQLVAAIRCPYVHLEQAVNVRFWAVDQHRREVRFFQNQSFTTTASTCHECFWDSTYSSTARVKDSISALIFSPSVTTLTAQS